MAAPSRENVQTQGKWPDWLEPYAKELSNLWMNTVVDPNTGELRPYDPNLDQRVAQFDPAQQSAINRIIDLSGSTDVQNRLGAAGEELTKTLKGEYLDPETNPYLRDTYNAASRALQDEYTSTTSPELMSAALRAKAFGSSAYQEYSDRQRFQLGQNLGDLATQIYGGNYAMERDRQQNAQQLLPSYMAAQYAPWQAQLEAGGMRQGQQQLEYDVGQQNALRRQQYPFGQLEALGGGLQAALGPAAGQTQIGRSRPGGIGAAMGLK